MAGLSNPYGNRCLKGNLIHHQPPPTRMKLAFSQQIFNQSTTPPCDYVFGGAGMNFTFGERNRQVRTGVRPLAQFVIEEVAGQLDNELIVAKSMIQEQTTDHSAHNT